MVLSSLFLLLPFLAAAAVPKDSCQDVDYSPKLGLIRNQESSDWCWASSAADLIGYAQGITPRNQVSIIDVALTGMTTTEQSLLAAAEATGDWGTYTAARSEAPYLSESEPRKNNLRLFQRQGWSLTAAISYTTRPRLCLESEVPSSPATPFLRGAERPRPSFLTKADLTFIEEQLRSFGDFSRDLKSVDKAMRILSYCVHEDAPLLSRYSDLFQEFNRIVLKNVADAVSEKCRNGPAVKPMTAEVRDFEQRGSGSPAAGVVSNWLATGPLSVSIPSGLLRKSLNSSSGSSKWHETVIVGRRWNEATGACEFKLRNSYGPDCSNYSAAFQGRCSGGYVWLTEAEVNDHARFAARLKVK